ncbi:hypothetical protein AUJ68_05495 [Candidatus Woesearchaeota archaeon CG1_02_57_44]|nr:MAG: hypothetical protein AUJ68_05495 [Candidatus Woesearchaeota archaeon CG1_02_57_44]
MADPLGLEDMLTHSWLSSYSPMVFGRNVMTVVQYALVRSLEARDGKRMPPAAMSAPSIKDPKNREVLEWLLEAAPWLQKTALPLEPDDGATYQEVSQVVTAIVDHFQDPLALYDAGYHYYDLNQGGATLSGLATLSRLGGTTSVLSAMLSHTHQFQNLLRPFTDDGLRDPQQGLVFSAYLVPPRLWDCHFTTGVYAYMPSIGKREENTHLVETHCGCDVMQILRESADLFNLDADIYRNGPDLYFNGAIVGSFVTMLSPPTLLPFQKSRSRDELIDQLTPIEGMDYQRLRSDYIPMTRVGEFMWPEDPNIAFLCTHAVDVNGRSVLRKDQFYNVQHQATITQDNRPRGKSQMPEVTGMTPTCVHYTIWDQQGLLPNLLARAASPFGYSRQIDDLQAALAAQQARTQRVVLAQEQLRSAVEQTAKYAAAFTQMLPRGIGRALVDGTLTSTHHPATMLFTDAAGFTAWSRSVRQRMLDAGTPEQAPQVINTTMIDINTPMVGALMGLGIWVDKYEGDAIMAIGGLPIGDTPDQERASNAHVEQMCLAAWCIREMYHHPDGTPKREMGIRIGINSGDVISGSSGAPQKPAYTVMGDDVNIASRMEGAVTKVPGHVMLGPATAAVARYSFTLQEWAPTSIKGLEEPVTAHDLTGIYLVLDNPYKVDPSSRAAGQQKLQARLIEYWQTNLQSAIFIRESALHLEDAPYREARALPRREGEIWGPLETMVDIPGINIARFDAVTGNLYGSLMRALATNLICTRLAEKRIIGKEQVETLTRAAFLYDCSKNQVEPGLFNRSDPPSAWARSEHDILRKLSLQRIAEQWPGDPSHAVVQDAYQDRIRVSGQILYAAQQLTHLVAPLTYIQNPAWSPQRAIEAVCEQTTNKDISEAIGHWFGRR